MGATSTGTIDRDGANRARQFNFRLDIVSAVRRIFRIASLQDVVGTHLPNIADWIWTLRADRRNRCVGGCPPLAVLRQLRSKCLNPPNRFPRAARCARPPGDRITLGSTGEPASVGRAFGIRAAGAVLAEGGWCIQTSSRRSRARGAVGPLTGMARSNPAKLPASVSAAGAERRRPLHTGSSELWVAAARTVDPAAAPGEHATVPDRVQDPVGQVEADDRRGLAANGWFQKAVCR